MPKKRALSALPAPGTENPFPLWAVTCGFAARKEQMDRDKLEQDGTGNAPTRITTTRATLGMPFTMSTTTKALLKAHPTMSIPTVAAVKSLLTQCPYFRQGQSVRPTMCTPVRQRSKAPRYVRPRQEEKSMSHKRSPPHALVEKSPQD